MGPETPGGEVTYTLAYHPAVRVDDLPRIPGNLRGRIEQAIVTRLAEEPERYGSPLRGTLRGYWKLRVGDYRVAYRIAGREVWIYAVVHRRVVYGIVEARASP
ncbi:MAG: type II toxin-antitoxin system RelE/ParE family toxin [Armatimonadetes bacterium]|nr:type II toxin-antitoxin system RelE/ParE family toxin [Armatimonadota bacterium]